MLGIMQMGVCGLDLLRGYPWVDAMKLVQQRGDMPWLAADADVVEAEVEDDVVGEILARLVNQWFCHDRSLGVR